MSNDIIQFSLSLSLNEITPFPFTQCWSASLTTEGAQWTCKRSRSMPVAGLTEAIVNLRHLAGALSSVPMCLVALSCLIWIYWAMPLMLTYLRYLSKCIVGLPPSNIQPAIHFLLIRAIKNQARPYALHMEPVWFTARLSIKS